MKDDPISSLHHPVLRPSGENRRRKSVCETRLSKNLTIDKHKLPEKGNVYETIKEFGKEYHVPEND